MDVLVVSLHVLPHKPRKARSGSPAVRERETLIKFAFNEKESVVRHTQLRPVP